jgi:hypothetical protein
MSLRRLLILLIAASFVFNGAALLAYIAVPAALAPFSDALHATGMASDQSTHFGLRQDNDSMMSWRNRAQSHDHVDGCLKCCHICSTANVVAIAPMTPVQFSYASVQFPTGADNPPDDFVTLDPGIPKFVI